MTDRKLFGSGELINSFIERLTNLGSRDGGWSTEYVDAGTGRHWLKYVVEDHGFFENMMLITPKPTTDELVDLVFSSAYIDEVSAAATRLNIEENIEKREFRKAVLHRLNQLDISQLNSAEKERVKTIIQDCQLTDRVNRRDIIGKHFSEIQDDAAFFQVVADKAHEILRKL